MEYSYRELGQLVTELEGSILEAGAVSDEAGGVVQRIRYPSTY